MPGAAGPPRSAPRAGEMGLKGHAWPARLTPRRRPGQGPCHWPMATSRLSDPNLPSLQLMSLLGTTISDTVEFCLPRSLADHCQDPQTLQEVSAVPFALQGPWRGLERGEGPARPCQAVKGPGNQARERAQPLLPPQDLSQIPPPLCLPSRRLYDVRGADGICGSLGGEGVQVGYRRRLPCS